MACRNFYADRCNHLPVAPEQRDVSLQKPTETELHLLMVAALEGDAVAYRALLEALARILRAYFQRRLYGDLASHAEDLVQETLLAVHMRRMTFDPAFPVRAWVHAIARHKLVDFLRRQPRQTHVPLDDLEEGLADPVDGVAGLQDRHDLARMLGHLPANTRQVIAKVRIEGKSIKETSSETGLSAASVKVIVHRGIVALRNRFGDKT